MRSRRPAGYGPLKPEPPFISTATTSMTCSSNGRISSSRSSRRCSENAVDSRAPTRVAWPFGHADPPRTRRFLLL